MRMSQDMVNLTNRNRILKPVNDFGAAAAARQDKSEHRMVSEINSKGAIVSELLGAANT